MEKGFPQLEVFEDQFWDVDLAFEASGGLEFTEEADKMSVCGEDISDVVEATNDGFELGSSGFSWVDQIGDRVAPGEFMGDRSPWDNRAEEEGGNMVLQRK